MRWRNDIDDCFERGQDCDRGTQQKCELDTDCKGLERDEAHEAPTLKVRAAIKKSHGEFLDNRHVTEALFLKKTHVVLAA